MREFVLLDSGPLGHACRRRGTRLGDQCRQWIDGLLARGVDIIVPEIADYEVRREQRAMGRVDLGGRPPRPPTDPGVHVKCTRFVTLWNRCPSHDWVVSR